MRIQVAVRLGAGGVTWLDQIARETRDDYDPTSPVPSRSDVIRAALVVARRHEAEVKKAIRETM